MKQCQKFSLVQNENYLPVKPILTFKTPNSRLEDFFENWSERNVYKRQTNCARQRFLGIYGELIKRLPEAEFVVYEPLDCRVGDWFGEAPNVSVRRSSLPSEGRARKFINGLSYWHNALHKERLDIFEGLNLPLIKAPTGRTLMTIHDIRGAQGKSGLLERMAYGVFLKRSLKSADHVITVSESMKRKFSKLYPIFQFR